MKQKLVLDTVIDIAQLSLTDNLGLDHNEEKALRRVWGKISASALIFMIFMSSGESDSLILWIVKKINVVTEGTEAWLGPISIVTGSSQIFIVLWVH